MIEQIKTDEPPRPRTIDATIPRDLETIVLKAIEKEPEAQYQSADEMSEDLRRFLADEPIRARQINAVGRSWRWTRRNPALAALGGVLMAVLVGVTAASLLVARRDSKMANAEREARREADEARKRAESANDLAEVETYRAVLNEVKAMRVSKQPG